MVILQKMDITARANQIKANLLPDKSASRYKKQLEVFQTWMKTQGYEDINEDTLLVYFEEKATTVSPNSLWSIFSMLKKCLLSHNLGSYHHLLSFLKKKNVPDMHSGGLGHQ